MKRLTWEYKDGGMFVDESEIKTYECDDVLMHTGNAIIRLSEYENIEEQLQAEYGANTTIKEVIQLLFKTIEEKDGEFLKGFRVLTNEDAKTYDEWKEQRDYWNREAITSADKLGKVRLALGKIGASLEEVLEEAESMLVK